MNKRYERNLLCDNFSEESQRQLQNAKVLVVGSGGLGSHVLQHLAAIGIGTIGIAEFDSVSESNLNRQVLYSTADIDSPKIVCAEQRLSALNPTIKIEKYPLRITSENINSIISLYDMVVDCTDNFEIRYIMDIACEKLIKPLIHGSVSNLKGSVTTFMYNSNKTYRSLYGKQQSRSSSPLGVLSPIVGSIGSIQASEVIKLITGIGTPLSEKLLTIDLETNSFEIFDI